eukprot:m.29491 g.29491  ORF g.29491 m.29491 type:complete len:847 (-) comp6159_c0_seq1:353-2893(-)
MADFLRSFVRRRTLGKIVEEDKREQEEAEVEVEEGICEGDDSKIHANEDGEEFFSDDGDEEEEEDVIHKEDEEGEGEEDGTSSVVIHDSDGEAAVITSSHNKNDDDTVCGDSGICNNSSSNHNNDSNAHLIDEKNDTSRKSNSNTSRNSRNNSSKKKKKKSQHDPQEDHDGEAQRLGVDDLGETIHENTLLANDMLPPLDREKTPSPLSFQYSLSHPTHTLASTTSTPSLQKHRGRVGNKGTKHQRSVSDVVGYDYVLGHTSSPSDDSDDNNSNHVHGTQVNDYHVQATSRGGTRKRMFGSMDNHDPNIQFDLGETTGYDDSYDEDEGDDDDDDAMESLFPAMEGILAKWTNYFHGWQERYFVLQKGNLSYFKSKEDTTKVCRGTMDLSHAKITPHPYDVLRFDVVLRDQAFCIRTSTTSERGDWVLAMKESQKLQTGGELSRQPSTLSLTSIASGNSNHAHQSLYRILTDKYTEARSLHEAFINQVEGMNLRILEGSKARDLQRQNALLKSTSSGLIRSLKDWMDLMTKREEEWRRKYDRINEKRRRAVDELRTLKEQRGPPLLGPDMEEGPHSTMNEEEFFDALEIGLDQLEAEEEETRRERELEEKRDAMKPDDGDGAEAPPHRFTAFMEDKLKDNLRLATEPVDEIWQLTYEENSMKVYSRESDETNQQKCFHFIKGITAKELCSYYWDGKIRLQWEHTIENLFVLEWLDKATCIQHNIHKRVWPTAQRDSCILSHIRCIDKRTWAVQNTSVEHADASSNKYVRLTGNILMYATTEYPDNIPISKLTRAEIGARITFLAYLHPGGWAPVSVVKAVSRREFPKFLKNLEQHSLKHVNSLPIDF